MKKHALLVAILPVCCLASRQHRVVIKEQASQLKRAPSDITNNLQHPPDWEMDYLVPSKDAMRLKGLNLHVEILDKKGRPTSKYVSYISNADGSFRASIRPKQTDRVWKARELGDVGLIVIVGER